MLTYSDPPGLEPRAFPDTEWKQGKKDNTRKYCQGTYTTGGEEIGNLEHHGLSK